MKTIREGPDIITTIASGDGEKKNRNARIDRSYAPGTTIQQVVKDLAEAMGVGLGNLNRIGKVEFPKAGATFPTGTTLSGNVSDELTEILRSAGLEYSIQDEQLQILTRDQALKDEVVILAPDSGLVGTASVGSDRILRCTTLMIPDIFPGRRVRPETESVQGDVSAIQSRGSGRRHLENFSGIFRCQKCIYTGDTSAGERWTIEIEADPLFRAAA